MKVVFVGDVMVGGVLSSNINENRKTFLSEVVRTFLKADVVFCNLESVLSKSEVPSEQKIALHAKEESVELLKSAGFNVVSLANNHAMDFGYSSLLTTMKVLDKNGIKYTGAGKNITEARKPAVINKDNLRISFLAYAAPETWGGWSERKLRTHKDWIADKNKPGVAPFDLELIKEDIVEANKETDFLVVSLHWGEEYTTYPQPEIISDAHDVINMGANVVIGAHPHVLQGYERYHNGLIMYSLSNFLFPSYHDFYSGELKKWSQKSRESIILSVEISEREILNYRLIPVVQKKESPTLISPSRWTRNRILRKMEFLSHEYQKSNYPIRYPTLLKRENRFKSIRLIVEVLETRGLLFLLRTIRDKLLRSVKKLK